MANLNQRVLPLSTLASPVYGSQITTDITLKASEPGYNEQMETISHHAMVYMNASGGLVRVVSVKPFNRKQADEWEQKVKQFMLNKFISAPVYGMSVSIETDHVNSTALIHVRRTHCLVTYRTRYFMRIGGTCEQVSDLDHIIHQIYKDNQVKKANLPHGESQWSARSYGSLVQEQENENMEFKCFGRLYGSRDLARKILADNIPGQNISPTERSLLSFPNTRDGGRLILGIGEKRKSGENVVFGQFLEKEEDAIFTESVAEIMKTSRNGQKRIWGDELHVPVRGREWDIFIHEVHSCPDDRRRVLIEIVVYEFTGGVFASSPECFTHTPNGQIRAMQFREWKFQMLARSMSQQKQPGYQRIDSITDHPVTIPSASLASEDHLDEVPLAELTSELKAHHGNLQSSDQMKNASWAMDSDYWGTIDGVTPTIKRQGLLTDLANADILSVSSPMTMAPDRSTLYRQIGVETGDMQRAWNTFDSNYQGVSSVCIGSERFSALLPVLSHITLPIGHVADLLVLSEDATLDIWTLHNSQSTTSVNQLYVFDIVRNLRLSILVMATQLQLSHKLSGIHIKGHLLNLQSGEHSDIPAHYSTNIEPGNTLIVTQMVLAKLLLEGDTHIKDRLGQEILVSLTRGQMERILSLDMPQISIIRGPPGSGKTIMALYLCDRMKTLWKLENHEIIYICPTAPLAAYIRQQGKCIVDIATHSQVIGQMKIHIQNGVRFVILDDAHAMKCKEKHWRRILEEANRAVDAGIRVAIFLDSTYQDYLGSSTELLRAAVDQATLSVRIYEPLHEMLRNSQIIFSFFKANAGPENSKLVLAHNLRGDDITVLPYKDNILQRRRGNAVVKVVQDLLNGSDSIASHHYVPSEIAVLVDTDGNGYGEKAANSILKILRDFLPESKPQRATQMPIRGLVVEQLRNYTGLDAQVCISVMINKSRDNKRNMNDHRFKLFVVSRGISLVIFMVPADDEPETLRQLQMSGDKLWTNVSV